MQVCYAFIVGVIKFATISKYFKFIALLLGMKIVIEINNIYMFSCLENHSKLQLRAKKLKKAIDTYRIFAKIASLSRRSRC